MVHARRPVEMMRRGEAEGEAGCMGRGATEVIERLRGVVGWWEGGEGGRGGLG